MCMFGVQNDMVAPRDCVAGIQSLLLTVMSNIARHFLYKRYSDSLNVDGFEEEQKSCFLDAAIGFCKLQHLDSTISTKYQVSHAYRGSQFYIVRRVCFMRQIKNVIVYYYQP